MELNKNLESLYLYQLITYQPTSENEIKILKKYFSGQNDQQSLFTVLHLLSKFYIEKITPKTLVDKNSSCYPAINYFTLKNNNIVNTIISSNFSKNYFKHTNNFILSLLNNFSHSHKNYFKIINKLKSESSKRFFHGFYCTDSIFSNFVKKTPCNFKLDIVISAPELYFFLKNKPYEKYDTNFNKTLEIVIKDLEKIFNYTLRIDLQKSNNTHEYKNYLHKKFNEHIYNFRFIYYPQKENKKEE